MRHIVAIIVIGFSIGFCSLCFADSATTTTVTTTPEIPTSTGPVTTPTTVTVTTTVDTGVDDRIVTAIYAKYAKDAALIGTNLTVTSKNGIVTLNGKVTAQSQADEAVQVAKSIDGVKDVRSSIIVTTNPDTIKPPTVIPNY